MLNHNFAGECFSSRLWKYHNPDRAGIPGRSGKHRAVTEQSVFLLLRVSGFSDRHYSSLTEPSAWDNVPRLRDQQELDMTESCREASLLLQNEPQGLESQRRLGQMRLFRSIQPAEVMQSCLVETKLDAIFSQPSES